VGRRRCARQQPHEDRGNADGAIAAQAKSGLIFMAPLSEASRAAVQLLIYINLSIRKSPFDREIVPMMH
jgi:hypothetical protein